MFFRGPKHFHDVPRPSGMNSALVDAQNGGLASIFEHFSSFWDKFPTTLVPKFRTLFEKVDLIWPLRPNRHVENDRIPIISL